MFHLILYVSVSYDYLILCNTYVNSSHLRIFSHVVFKTEVKLCGFY